MTELQFALAVSVMGKAQKYWEEHQAEKDRNDKVSVPIGLFTLQERAFIKSKTNNRFVQFIEWSPLKNEPQVMELVQPIE